MKTVNEASTSYLTVSFYDKDGVLAVPTSITYRIDEPHTDTAILASTAVSAASSVDITITPTQNTHVVTKWPEKRVVTVTAVYGASDSISEEYEYQIKNLQYV